MSDIRPPCGAGHPFPSNMNVKSRVSHGHLKCIWRINRNSLKVLGCRNVHAGHRRCWPHCCGEHSIEPVTFDAFYLSPDWPAPPKKGQPPRSPSPSKEIAMTILNSNSSYPATPPAVRRAFGIFMARLARRINGWIAAVIAHRQRQANLVVLRHLSVGELKGIGLHRGAIEATLSKLTRPPLRI